MKIYICQVCGHLMFGDQPDKCPVCGSEKKNMKQNDDIFKESKEKSPEAEVKHQPSVIINKECGLIPEADCTDLIVRVGKTLHPMEEKHFIQFIDCYLDQKFLERTQFTPYGVNPAGCFHLKNASGVVTIVENCNIHGYWKTDETL